MLIGYDSTQPIYVIGTGMPAQEIAAWIRQDYPTAQIHNLSPEQYESLPANSQCIVGFATFEYRKKLINHSTCSCHRWLTYIHPTSLVEDINCVGAGSLIGPGAIVMYSVSVGTFAWITPHVLLGHGTTVGNNVVISSGTIIGGSTVIGNNVFIGQSASIIDRITICDDVFIGMASVVTKSIVQPGNYIGNKKINKDDV